MAKKPRKILCIEDDPDMAVSVAEEFVKRGFEVSIAHDGQQGFVEALKEKPDLVLCDTNVSIMSGFEVLERLTGIAPSFGRIPFIFLAELADRDNELKGRRLGADDYVTKPIDFELLIGPRFLCCLEQSSPASSTATLRAPKFRHCVGARTRGASILPYRGA